MTQNPFKTCPGFGLRVHQVEQKLRRYATDFDFQIFARSFDNCFEMGDGDAVVFALVKTAKIELEQTGFSTLAEGINRTFGRPLLAEGFPDDWEQVYQQGTNGTQLSLLLKG